MRDVVETRRFLEVRALEDALTNKDDRWEGDLVAAFHRFEKASNGPLKTRAEREVWEERHTALHRALLGGCRSQWLLHSWSAVFDQAERYRRLAIEIQVEPSTEIREHAKLVNAALKREVEKCCKFLGRHIGSSADRLSAPLEKVWDMADGLTPRPGTAARIGMCLARLVQCNAACAIWQRNATGPLAAEPARKQCLFDF